MGSFLNSVTQKMNEQSQGEKVQPFEWNEQPVEVYSERGKREYDRKTFEETKAFLMEKGFLPEGTEDLGKYIDALMEGKPIIAVQIGTTGLNRNQSRTVYNEHGDPVGKLDPFLEHQMTQLGAVVYERGDDGKYHEAESYLAVMKDVSDKAIKEVYDGEFRSKCIAYNGDKRQKPFDEYKGYNAFREGGFAVLEADGGFGFRFEDREKSPLCKDGKTVTEDLKALQDKYKDALMLTNMGDLEGWLSRSGVTLNGSVVLFGDIMKEYQMNSDYGKANALTDKETGAVINRFGLEGLIKKLGIELEQPFIRSDNKARAFMQVLELVADKVDECLGREQQSLKEEIAEKQKELESTKTIKQSAEQSKTEPKAEPTAEQTTEPKKEEPKKDEQPKAEQPKAEQSINEKYGSSKQSLAEKYGKAKAEPTAEPTAEQKAEKSAVADNSSLERLGTLGDMGMSVGDNGNAVAKKLGMEFVATVSADLFGNMDDKKALYGELVKMSGNVAKHCKDIIGTPIRMSDVTYILSDDDKMGISVNFIGIPDDKVDEVKLFLKEVFADHNNISNNLGRKDEIVPVLVFGETNEYDRTLDMKVPTMDEHMDKLDEYMGLLEETLEAEREQKEAEQNTEQPKAEQKTEQKAEPTAERSKTEPQTVAPQTAVPLEQAFATLVSAINRPLIDKIDELQKEVGTLIARNEKLIAINTRQSELLEKQSEQIAEISKQNTELKVKLDSASRVIDEISESQTHSMTKLVELTSKLMVEKTQKEFEQKKQTTKGIG